MNLYETAFWAKKAAYGFVVFIVILIACWIGRSFIERVTLIINRPPAEAPQNGYGPLASLNPKSNLVINGFSPEFSIETVTSQLPTFNDYNGIINVYKLEEKPRDLESDQKARSVATNLGFKSQPKITNDTIYFWNENGKVLNYNRQYSVFDYSVGSVAQPSEKTTFPLTDSQNAASTIFTKAGVNFSSENQKLGFKAVGEYVDYDFRTKVAKKSKAGEAAQFVRINIVRSISVKSGIEGLVDIMDFDRNTSLVSIIMRNHSTVELENVAQINFYNWNIDPEKGQTYRIISSEDAYKKLSEAKKTLISAKFTKDETLADEKSIKSIGNIRVLDVRLGYYQSQTVQTFTQPIYEFRCEGTTITGENIDLLYYVPALP